MMKAILLSVFVLVSLTPFLMAAPVRDGRYSQGYPGDYRKKSRAVRDGRYTEGYSGDYRRGRKPVADGRYSEGYPGNYDDDSRGQERA